MHCNEWTTTHARVLVFFVVVCIYNLFYVFVTSYLHERCVTQKKRINLPSIVEFSDNAVLVEGEGINNFW